MIRNPYDHYLVDDEVYCSLSYSDVNPYQRTGPPREFIPSSLLSSITTGRGTSPRQYIDPWDLENYAYLQRRGSDTETAEGAYTSEDCESTASSQFYYRRGGDHQEYYDHLKYKTAALSGAPCDNQHLFDYGPVCDGSCSCRSEYGGIYSPATDYGTRRPRLLQDPEPQLQFPPPPYDYDPYDLDSSDAHTVMECQECSLSMDKKIYASRSDDIYYTPTPPRHFSLSKKGLLQIDYSCNWNCLDFNCRRM